MRLNEQLTLDVGCGSNPKGDVNCDLYKDLTPQNGSQKELTKVKRGKNFVQCDAQHLPFRDNAFVKVYSFHVIEHVEKPALMLKELLRVTNGLVIIKCPHRFGRTAKMPFHKNYFNVAWFRRSLKGKKIKIYVSYRGFPHAYVSLLRLPDEITVVVEK